VRALRKLLFGDTWSLPAGLVLTLLVALALRDLVPGAWRHAGGFLVLAGVAAAVGVAVQRSATPRR
jgi:hypothetical protein